MYSDLKKSVQPSTVIDKNVSAPVELYYLLHPKSRHRLLEGSIGKKNNSIFINFKWDKIAYMVVRDRKISPNNSLYYCAVALDEHTWANLNFSGTQDLLSKLKLFFLDPKNFPEV